MLKRITTLLLVFAMVLSMVPATAQAEEATTTVDSSNLSTESTNSFGALLGQNLEQYQADANAAADTGYTVTGLVIEGNTATVTYDTLEKASLVVALYTEDGTQLLLSASTTAAPEDTQAVLTLSGAIPAYFYAAAYLLDWYDMSPLCPAYETPMYTKEMQALLNSTVADYDPDRVLNLDDRDDTNFVVYAEDTQVIQSAEGVNTVVSVDDTNRVYVIDNADASITGLQAGDVFVHFYGEEDMLIAKVDTIQVSGTTATITGAELELEEVFSQIKIEGDADTQDAQVDTSTATEGVTYDGLMESPSTYALEGDFGSKFFMSFSFLPSLEGDDDDGVISGEMEIDIRLGLEISSKVSYYASFTRQFIEFRADVDAQFSVTVSAECSLNFSLGEITVLNVYGLMLKLEPAILLELSCELELTFHKQNTLGFSFEAGNGFQNLCSSAEAETELSVEGTFFVGIDFRPKLVFLHENLIKLELGLQVGFQITATLTGQNIAPSGADAANRHSCAKCLDIEIARVIKIEIVVQFLKLDRLKFSKEFSFTRVFAHLYYSFDHHDLGWGECPYKEYLICVSVTDADGKPVAGAGVGILDGGIVGYANENGALVFYYPGGDLTLVVLTAVGITRQELSVPTSCSAKITLASSGASGGLLEGVGSAGLLDLAPATDFGSCGADGSDVMWQLHGGSVLHISGTGAVTASTWNSHASAITMVLIDEGITAIPDGLFQHLTSLTTVMLPDTLTVIGSKAFYGCTSLRGITIPAGVSTISSQAFSLCRSLHTFQVDEKNANYMSNEDGVLLSKDQTTLIALPGGITAGYTVPDSVTTIASWAFLNGSTIQTVRIPGSVTTLEDYVFSGQEAYIFFPGDAPSFGSGTFTGVTANVYYPADNATWTQDVLQNYGGTLTWTDIATIATSGTCGEGVSWDLSPAGTLTISGTGTITATPWSHVGGLISAVVVGEGVQNLPEDAFATCGSLASITISSTVTDIAPSVLQTPTLNGFYVASGNPAYASDQHGVLFNQEKTQLLHAPQRLNAYTVPEGVVSIGENAFRSCNLTRISLPAGIREIGDNAFYDCPHLTSISIPEGTTKLGASAFRNCTALSSVQLPGTLTDIGTYTFAWCESLTGVTLPEHITEIPDGMISYCHSITSFTIPAGVSGIGDYAFAGCTGLTSLAIPNSVTSMGDYAFLGCTGLTSLVIPEHITEIPEGMLFNCHNITSFTIPAGVTRIGRSAFTGCYELTTLVLPAHITKIPDSMMSGCRNITSLTIPAGVTSIGDYAFSRCTGLTQLTIPSSVTSLGSYAFYNSTGLQEVTLHASITYISPYTFAGCTALKKAMLPDSVTHIQEHAFENCTSLVSISLPASLTDLYDRAFYNCSSLKEITIPEGITIIDKYVFAECASLETVTFPSTLTHIDDYAFYGCRSLWDDQAGSLPEGLTSIGVRAFAECFSMSDITLPTSLTELGYRAFYNSYMSAITFLGDAPEFADDIFNCALTIYYPADNPTWTEDVRKDYGATTTWVAFTPGTVTQSEVSQGNGFVDGGIVGGEVGNADAVFGGDVSSAPQDGYTLKTATFTDLVPGKEYVLLVLADVSIEALLNPDNLLYIRQASAAADGTLTFQYIQRRETALAYVMVCGASDKDLANAVITFPAMQETGNINIVRPTVVYDGVTLTEGVDYVIVSGASYLQNGEYTCKIRGIRSYTGLVSCTYTVGSVPQLGSGVCGPNLTWSISENGVLTISGTGNMNSYNYGSAPWYADYQAQIKKVVICSGVTGIGKYAFYNLPSLTEVNLCPEITTIGDGAFFGCTALTGITLHSGLTSLGESAFRECKKLRYAVLPEGITEIGRWTFEYCSALEEIHLPDSITYIDQEAFEYSGLKKITLPKGLKEISKAAFRYCSRLESVTFSGNVTDIGVECFMNCNSLSQVTLCEGVQTICDSAFRNTAITEIDLPDSLTSLGSYAFAYSQLRSVTVPAGVTSLYNTFDSCAQLTDVTLSEGITTISGAFNNCNSLTSLFIPKSVSCLNADWGYSANMQSFQVDPENPYYCTDEYGTLFNKDKTVLYNLAVPSLTSYVIPDGVTSISSYAFLRCTQLTQLTVPASVTQIPEFGLATALPSSTPMNVTFRGDRPATFSSAAFGYNKKTAILRYPGCNQTWNTKPTVNGSITWESYGHAYIQTWREANCMQYGGIVYTCSKCGYSYCDNSEKKTPCSYDAGVITTAPTCTQTGVKTFTCTVCGNSYTTSIPATGHSYTGVITPPTCTGDGHTTYTCTHCADSYTADMFPATGHSYHDGVCTVCGYTETYTVYFDNAIVDWDQVYVFYQGSTQSIWPGISLTQGSNGLYAAQVPQDAQGLIFHDGTEIYSIESPTIPTANQIYDGFQWRDYGDTATTQFYVTGSGVMGEWVPNHAASLMTNQGGGIFRVTYDNVPEGNYTYAITNGTWDQIWTDGNNGNYSFFVSSPSKVIITFNVNTHISSAELIELPEESFATPPTVTLRFPALSFKDEVVMDVFFSAENLNDVEEMGLVTYSQAVTQASVNTAEYVIPGYTWSDSNGFYYASTQGIAPHYLANTYWFAVYAKLTDGTYTYTRVVSYSPLTYANSILSGAGYSTDMKTLAAAMLNYGAAAQVYFGVEGELMNKGLTAEQSALVAPYSSSMLQSVGTVDSSKVGIFTNTGGFVRKYPNVTFEGAFSINYFFTPSNTPDGNLRLYYWNQEDYNNAATLTPGNATGSIVMTPGDSYSAVIDGIVAKDLDSTIYVTVGYNANGSSYCSGVLAYSIGAYCVSQASGGSTQAMRDLAKATAVYAYYAKQLFA